MGGRKGWWTTTGGGRHVVEKTTCGAARTHTQDFHSSGTDKNLANGEDLRERDFLLRRQWVAIKWPSFLILTVTSYYISGLKNFNESPNIPTN